MKSLRKKLNNYHRKSSKCMSMKNLNTLTFNPLKSKLNQFISIKFLLKFLISNKYMGSGIPPKILLSFTIFRSIIKYF